MRVWGKKILVSVKQFVLTCDLGVQLLNNPVQPGFFNCQILPRFKKGPTPLFRNTLFISGEMRV